MTKPLHECTNEELLRELFARFDVAVFAGSASGFRNTDIYRANKGAYLPLIGLIASENQRLMDAYNSTEQEIEL